VAGETRKASRSGARKVIRLRDASKSAPSRRIIPKPPPLAAVIYFEEAIINFVTSPRYCRIINMSIGQSINHGGTMAYTLDTTVGTIMDDTNAVKILEKYVPGISKNPMLGLAKGMALKSLLAMPQAKQAGITEDMVKKVLAEINALKK
jgi:hypothetical protein